VAAKGLVSLELCERRLDELIEQRACFSMRDLAVNGDDLRAIGFEQGRELGRVLEVLLIAVIDGELKNDRETLLAVASSELSSVHSVPRVSGGLGHIMDT
jgi:tRNA nucleotidyltransferase (CCA-adding enzyme)